MLLCLCRPTARQTVSAEVSLKRRHVSTQAESPKTKHTFVVCTETKRACSSTQFSCEAAPSWEKHLNQTPLSNQMLGPTIYSILRSASAGALSVSSGVSAPPTGSGYCRWWTGKEAALLLLLSSCITAEQSMLIMSINIAGPLLEQVENNLRASPARSLKGALRSFGIEALIRTEKIFIEKQNKQTFFVFITN